MRQLALLAKGETLLVDDERGRARTILGIRRIAIRVDREQRLQVRSPHRGHIDAAA
jgi:hypothetical protein